MHSVHQSKLWLYLQKKWLDIGKMELPLPIASVHLYFTIYNVVGYFVYLLFFFLRHILMEVCFCGFCFLMGGGLYVLFFFSSFFFSFFSPPPFLLKNKLMNLPHSNKKGGCPRGVMVKALGYGIVVSEFKL